MRTLTILLIAAIAVPAVHAEDVARMQLQGALDAMQLVDTQPALEVSGSGWTDLGLRLQGTRPFVAERVEHSERWWFGSDGTIGYETHGPVNPDADEHYRFVHDGGEHMLIVEHLAGTAFWVPADQGMRDGYRRVAPHRLLHEALASDAEISLQDDGRWRLVLADTQPLLLSFDAGNRLTRVAYMHTLPVHGDVEIAFEYAHYEPVPGFGLYPAGHRITLDGRAYREVSYTAVRSGDVHAYSELAGIELPPRPAPSGPVDVAPDAVAIASPASEPEPAPTTEVADGVHLVRNVRGGFAALIVELSDGLMVVDAPAGYHELQMLPAIDWAGPHPASWAGERLLATARAVAPERPVRYVVLTHHHQDHMGGVRAFIDAGATLVLSPETVPAVRAAAGYRSTLEPDALDASGREPSMLVVDRPTRFLGGERSVEVLAVPDNPHALGTLLVHLPSEALLFQSDLFNGFGAGGPDPARVPVMRWFSRWLLDQGLDGVDVYGAHGRNPAGPDQIRELAETAY